MMSRLPADVRVFPDLEALSRAAAAHLAAVVAVRASAGPRVSLALAGGTTPRRLYRVLALEYREQIPWAQVHLFWGDERYVSHDDPRSNYGMARASLLDALPVPADNVHPMPTDLPDPEAAALAYEQLLRSHFRAPWPRFDLVLLGLGADGHTASLFPGTPALEERRRWVVATRAPADPPLRLTVTLPVLTRAAHVSFLVAGADKAPALRRALADPPEPQTCPAAAVRPADGAVVWWVAAAAVAALR